MRKFILSILLTFSGFILQAQDFKQFFITTWWSFWYTSESNFFPNLLYQEEALVLQLEEKNKPIIYLDGN